jgi:hypothetical protein
MRRYKKEYSKEISEHVEKLPEALQAKVLDFVEYLESKISRDNKRSVEDEDWSQLSLSSAMRDMEVECSPYSIDDIKEKSKEPKSLKGGSIDFPPSPQFTINNS